MWRVDFEVKIKLSAESFPRHDSGNAAGGLWGRGEMGQLSAAIYWIVARVRADGRRRGCRDHCTGVKSSKAGPRLGPKTKGR